MSLRVRYAPSPTGLHHIGGARTALFAYLLARSAGGTFILRIEDTDRARFDPAALEDIYDTLGWLGLRWDEGPSVGGPHGPYVQSERVERHRAVAARLVETGRAYRCYCDPERLQRVRGSGGGYDRRCRNLSADERRQHEERGEPSVVRFKVPLDGATRYEDRLLGPIERRNSDINPDPVLLKSDGYPTYHLAAITDDHDMRVSHVLRAQEWVSSAPLHVLIFQACGWKPPLYAHLPVVNGPDGKKLSKRHGSMSVAEFRDQGYLPEALVNYMALLGWSLDGERELFSLPELERSFSLERLHASPAIFDADKLRWMNGTYIRALPPEELSGRLAPWLAKAGAADPQGVAQPVADLVRERLTVLGDTIPMAGFLFAAELDYDGGALVPKRLDGARTARVLERSLDLVDTACGPDEEAAEQVFRTAADELGVKFGDLMMPVRVAITGARVSPPLFGSMRILGAETCRDRLRTAIVKLAEQAPDA
ncbi:MAG: glutamate--tRNA ligase [Spirochaetaceae bacterium]|nr:glutamate--tRNA ligase [Spirochaetaceae bacterium]